MNNKPSTVKQCHITKENETSQIMNLTQRERLLQTQFRIYKLIYDEIKNEKEWINILGNKSESSNNNLVNNELYDTIGSLLKSFKIWLFENINSSFYDSYLEEKSFIQKNILEDFFNGIKETSEKSKDKIETITQNAIIYA